MSWQISVPFTQSVRLRSEELGTSRRATWLELFFDLIFVAAVAQVGLPLSEDYTLHGLVRYALMFLLIWWAWFGHTMYSTRFETDDVLHRVLTLVQIFAAAAMAANAKAAFDSRDSAGFGAAYAVIRAVLVIQYLRARRMDRTRILATLYAIGFGTAALLWGVAALTPTPLRFWLWAVALFVDLGTPWLVVQYTHKVPPGREHLPERFGLFTIILLGESVAAVMRGMESQEAWPVSAAISAFTGLALAFGLWWWYFDGVRGAGERDITSSRQTVLFQIWSYAHFPLYLSVAVVGVGVEHVISLSPGTRLHSEDAWILVGAASALMLTLQIIGWTSNQDPASPSEFRALPLALCFVALPLPLFVEILPACTLVVVLTFLCGLQLKLAAGYPQRHRDHTERTAELTTDFQAL